MVPSPATGKAGSHASRDFNMMFETHVGVPRMVLPCVICDLRLLRIFANFKNVVDTGRRKFRLV